MGSREKYYEKLKVKPGASMDEVNRACRGQVKFWHPDRFPYMSTRLQNKAHEMLQEINDAYKKYRNFISRKKIKRRMKNHLSGKGLLMNQIPWMRNPPTGRKQEKLPAESPRKTSPPKPLPGMNVCEFPNGDHYEGEIRENRMHGQGTYFYANGDSYTGEFINGLPDGNGSFAFASGDVYVGQFKNEVMNDQGTYTYASGDRYTGEFKDSMPHGRGTYILKNGNRYDGTWEKGEFKG